MDVHLEKGWLNSGQCECSAMSSPHFPARVAYCNAAQEDRDHRQCLPADEVKCTICSQCSSHGSYFPKATLHLALLVKGAVQGRISYSSSGGSRTGLAWPEAQLEITIVSVPALWKRIPHTSHHLNSAGIRWVICTCTRTPISVSLLCHPSITTATLFSK